MVTEHPTTERVFRADWVLPLDGPPLRGAAVRVRGSRIVAVEPTLSTTDGESVVDLGAVALLPGLVNTHTHLELTLLRGLCERADFFAWIRELTAIKYQRMEPEDFALGARWGLVECVRHGITTVGDCGDQGVVRDALVESGLRGIVYHEVFGPDPRDCDASLERLVEQLREARRGGAPERVRLGVSPHAPYTVSDALFRAVADWARRDGLPISLHAAESAAESAYVRDAAGPFAESLRARGISCVPRGVSPVAYLEDLGVLAARPLLVHGCEMDASDIARVSGAGARVAHCPKSNAKLGHRRAPLEAWRAAKLSVGLGTDGAVSNNTCDLFEEARCALQLARLDATRDEDERPRLDAAAALRLATLGGAEALGLEGEIGSITPGKRADLIAVDLRGAHLQPLYDVPTVLVFGARGADVCWTMVHGEVLYENGRVRCVDEEALAREVRERAARVARTSHEPPATST